MCKCVILMLCAFLLPFINGQEITQEKQSAIEEEISRIVEKSVQENVTPLIIAEELKMSFPPKVPVKTQEELLGEVSVLVKEMVEKKFPDSIITKHLAEARKKYVVYKKGETITIRVSPTGRAAVVTGKFKGYNRKGELRIGGYDIPKVDMTEDVMVHFDEELSKKKIARYMENKLFYYREDRKTYKAKLIPRITKKIFLEAGYFPSGKKFLPADQFLKKSIEDSKVSYCKKMTDILTEVTFNNHGYIKKEGKWVVKPAQTITVIAKSPKKENFKKPITVEDKIKASDLPTRKREKLFDPSFYDPDFE